jgi:hypothetical protein
MFIPLIPGPMKRAKNLHGQQIGPVGPPIGSALNSFHFAFQTLGGCRTIGKRSVNPSFPSAALKRYYMHREGGCVCRNLLYQDEPPIRWADTGSFNAEAA